MDVLLFLARRLAIAAVLLVVLTFVTFVIFFQIPSEPAQFLVDTKTATQAQIKEARHILGADRPVHVQFAKYVWRLAHADFGRSWRTYYVTPEGAVVGTPVSHILRDAAGVTASLVLGGAALLLLVSIPLGAWSASRPRSLLDRTVAAGSLVGISTHPLVVALLLQLFVGFRWHVAPASGYCPIHGQSVVFTPGEPPCGGLVDWASHLVLPWITFALFFVALYIRIVRVRMIEVLSEPYIRTARAKGASSFRVVRRHALPNSMLAIVTMIGMDIGTALGVCIYIESVFNLPGLGHRMVDSTALGVLDMPLMVGVIFVSAVTILALNLLIDLTYSLVDPRITRVSSRMAEVPERRFA
ncbi:MAG TPA: ABC transporter permease [Gaiellaceae bacterium]|nr:ABC transporter permease [Gaiellaceae bacterium]